MEKLVARVARGLCRRPAPSLLRRRAAPSVALLLTAAYAFGTPRWMIQQPGALAARMAQLRLIGLLLLLTARRRWRGRSWRAPVRVVTAPARPMRYSPRRSDVWSLRPGGPLPAFAAGAAVPLGAGAALQRHRRRRIVGPMPPSAASPSSSMTPVRVSPAAVQPTRGLPGVLAVPRLPWLAWRNRPIDPARPPARHRHRGRRRRADGDLRAHRLARRSVFRARFLTDMVPLLILAAGCPWSRARRIAGSSSSRRRRGDGLAAIGAFTYDGFTDRRSSPAAVPTRCGPPGSGGKHRSSPGLRQGAPRPSLVLIRRGAIETIEVAGRAAEIIPPRVARSPCPAGR